MKNVNKLVMLLVILSAALFSSANNIRVGIGAYNPTTKSAEPYYPCLGQ